MLKKFGENIWTASDDFTVLGCNFGCRMTIIKLGANILLHSPIKFSEKLFSSIKRLGNISLIVAPNSFHHLYVAEWQKKCPNANVLAIKDIQAKNKKLLADEWLDDSSKLNWHNDLSCFYINGGKLFKELVIYHTPTKTLIVTDLLFNLRPKNLKDRLLFPLLGIKNYPSATRLLRLVCTPTKKSLALMKQISELPIDAIVLSHGNPITDNAQMHIKRAWQ